MFVWFPPFSPSLLNNCQPTLQAPKMEPAFNISANGFCEGHYERTLFSVQVFNPSVPSTPTLPDPMLSISKMRQVRCPNMNRERSSMQLSFFLYGQPPVELAYQPMPSSVVAKKRDEEYIQRID